MLISNHDKTPTKFQKDLAKVVGGVAFTRKDTFSDRQSDRQTDGQMVRPTHGVKQNRSLDPDGGRHNYIYKEKNWSPPLAVMF